MEISLEIMEVGMDTMRFYVVNSMEWKSLRLKGMVGSDHDIKVDDRCT